MKRTLTSIAAASLVLGTMAPVAMAATTTSYSFAQRHVTVDGHNLSNPWGFVSGGTNYFPIYYLQTAIGSLIPGATATWDGKNLMVNIAGFDATKLMGPTVPGANGIYINGTLVQKFTRIVTNDKGTKVQTSFAPIYALFGVLEQLGLKSTWSSDGTWGIAPALAKLTIAGNGNIGLGGSDTLSLTGTDSAGNAVAIDQSKVVWSATGGVLSSAGVFAATAAGTYTVTATYMGMSTTGTVAVYGNAAGVKVTLASPTLVSNGVSTDVATVTVVDANGNAVSNYNGPLTVSRTTPGGASSYTDSTGAATLVVPTLTAVNGVATFTLISTVGSAGQSDTYTLGGSYTNPDGTTTNLTTATATVSSVAQVATSIKVTPAQTTLANNTVTSTGVTAQVLDQAGDPMVSGVYQLTYAVSGAGTFAAASTTAVSTAATYNVPDVAVEASVPVYSIQGTAGTINVSVTGTNLTSGSASIASTAVGQEAAIKLATSTSSTTADGSRIPVTVTLVDSNGNPSAVPSGTVQVNLDEATTTGALQFFTASTGGGAPVTSVAFNAGQSTQTVYVMSKNNAAGSYNMTAVDNASSLTAATNLPLSVTAGAADAASLAFTNKVAQNISASSPTVQVSVQLNDMYGNPVSEAGQYVQFQVSPPLMVTNKGLATLNGVAASNPIVVQTGANGVATVTLAAQPYYNDSYQVHAQLQTSGGVTFFGDNEQTSPVYTVSNTVSSALSVAFTTSGGNPTTQATSGVADNGTISVTDAYGNPVTGDEIEVTVNNGAILSTSGFLESVTLNTGLSTTTQNVYDITGGYGFQITGGKAGVTTIGLKDLSANGITGTGSLNVVAGTVSNVTAVNASGAATGQSVTTAGVYGPYTVEVTDAGGNVVNAGAAVTLDLTQLKLIFGPNVIGVRTSSAGTESTSLTLAAGTPTATVYLDTTGNIGSGPALDLGTSAYASSVAPAAPTGVVAAPIAGTNTVAVNWNTVPNATGYNVSVSKDSGATWSSVAPNLPTANYTYTATAAGQSVEFSVTAVNVGGTSAPATSNVASSPVAVLTSMTATKLAANVAGNVALTTGGPEQAYQTTLSPVDQYTSPWTLSSAEAQALVVTSGTSTVTTYNYMASAPVLGTTAGSYYTITGNDVTLYTNNATLTTGTVVSISSGSVVAPTTVQ